MNRSSRRFCEYGEANQRSARPSLNPMQEPKNLPNHTQQSVSSIRRSLLSLVYCRVAYAHFERYRKPDHDSKTGCTAVFLLPTPAMICTIAHLPLAPAQSHSRLKLAPALFRTFKNTYIRFSDTGGTHNYPVIRIGLLGLSISLSILNPPSFADTTAIYPYENTVATKKHIVTVTTSPTTKSNRRNDIAKPQQQYLGKPNHSSF